MKIRNQRIVAVATGAVIVVGLGSAGAVAADMIGSRGIKDDSIRSVDIRDGGIKPRDLSGRVENRLQGASGLEGAYYSVASYNAGNTNAGAIATVACKSETDTAISGGVQVLGIEEGANARNTPVSSSFPGRMDWTTNAPREGRLDGWIVQFGGNAGQVSDKNPEKAKIWALCVPGADVPVEETYTQQPAG